MNIFYGNSCGKADVPGDCTTQASLETALEVFRGLDPQSGFMGIHLDERFVVQFAPKKHSRIRVELLDTARPAFDACVTDAEFAEELIQAAAEGRDVFQIARTSKHEWEHTDMGR
ncbi:MAG: hypothetical protein AB1705_27430 [Verrucomicrobiota bacterium]